ncbi:hypothetical protein [Cytobacillus oceanisediminis]|uniref:hypothetical protein n=1 Tax=Cytobacillus oceanisediminis TaxID=665099 RepID=UPI002041C44B|nr:hypothetical protein [Cytobacillus oceanisediminis]MCM3404268.1 hypothetical protein [Cytobacillus oceanisediminis]
MNSELLVEIKRLYYDEKKSTRQVADIVRIQAKTVIKYLNKNATGTRDIKLACQLRTTDEYREKIKITQIGEKNNSAKLSEKEVLKIRQIYEDLLSEGHGKTQAQHYLAKKYGVKRPTVSDIVCRRTWKHI